MTGLPEQGAHSTGRVTWNDLEFIRDLPAPPTPELPPDELTGWETIVFELDDEPILDFGFWILD